MDLAALGAGIALIAIILLLAWSWQAHSAYCNALWERCVEARGGRCQPNLYTTDDCGQRVDWPPCATYNQACRDAG